MIGRKQNSYLYHSRQFVTVNKARPMRGKSKLSGTPKVNKRRQVKVEPEEPPHVIGSPF